MEIGSNDGTFLRNFKKNKIKCTGFEPAKNLLKHKNNKGAKMTKGYKWKLIFKKTFKNKNNAISFEYKIKKNRKERKLILDNFNK